MNVVSTMTPPGGIAELAPITLAALDDAASLQTRVDRKYILDTTELDALVGNLAWRLAALDIDGRRSFGYESVYFDTAALESYRSAAYKRRRRFKVRTRTYLDSQTTMLEVKTRGQRGVTVKKRQAHRSDRRTALDGKAAAFVDLVTGRPGLASVLHPLLTTTYDRTTLADLDDVARLTIDAGLRCTGAGGRSVTIGDHFIVETKSAGSPSAVDRWLWAHGRRPTKISKFGTGLAALESSLPSNKWHRTLTRYFS